MAWSMVIEEYLQMKTSKILFKVIGKNLFFIKKNCIRELGG